MAHAVQKRRGRLIISDLKRFTAQQNLSIEALCGEIFDRHRETIQIKKRPLGVANLARIVTAALAVSNKKGFQSMSLRDLTDATGLSMGGLYSYFDSKETLLMMILNQVDAVIGRVFQTPAALADDPPGRLRWLVWTHVALSEVLQPWFIFAFMEARSFGEEARRFVLERELRTEALFVSVLEEGARTGLFKVENPVMTASLIKPMLQDWYIKRWKHRARNIAAAAYADFVVAFVESAVLREPSPRLLSAVAPVIDPL
jgi:AcrR family transcriptional regulator